MAELKLRRVALFSSGVGYFEHEAAVTDDDTAELRFRTEQIDDLLKSLVAQDFDGGLVGVVGYSSKDPVDQTLKTFAVDITGEPTLGQLLNQLRGEPIEIAGPRKLRGTILGVESRRRFADDKTVIKSDVLNLATDGGLEQLPLPAVQGLRLLNAQIAGELNAALAALADGRDAEKKTVGLCFNGQGQRRVRLAYLIEAPIWKATYRLVLSEDAPPYLQGWAIIENTTEHDWDDVQLSLVSGRPISFRMDLYTPIHVPRPEETLELHASLRPPEFEGGMAVPAATQPPKRSRSARREAVDQDVLCRSMEAESFRDALAYRLDDSGVEATATGEKAGELFEYRIKVPVSIDRRRSAMLPIVSERIEAERLSIYNHEVHARHPLNGIRLTNTTPLHLAQGPITVFADDLYAGDAKLPHLKPDECRLLAYALDLAVDVLIETESPGASLERVTIVRGRLCQQRKSVIGHTYIVHNKSDALRTVILEHPIESGWSIVEPAEVYERTEDLVRFKLDVPAGETASFPVRAERVEEETTAFSNVGTNLLEVCAAGTAASGAVKDVLRDVLAGWARAQELARRRSRVEKKLKEATAEQKRVRDNLDKLPADTDAHQRQLAKFDELETQIEALTADLVERRTAEDRVNDELEERLTGLDVD